MNYKYKVGDRVKCIESHDGNDLILLEEGIILHMKEWDNKPLYTIEFDDYVGGHRDYGGKEGHVWNIPESKIKSATISWKKRLQ